MTEETGAARRRLQPESPMDVDPAGCNDYSPDQVRHVIHELQVHQLELEMQNDELTRIQAEMEDSKNRYASLYDFAPVGYVTLNPQSIIQEANLTFASMLGVTRDRLLNTPFSRFILKEDHDEWYRWFVAMRENGSRQACEVSLPTTHGRLLCARLDARTLEDSQVTRIAVTDVTELKRAATEHAELEKRLLHAQKLESLGVLAGGIAHDFNNLLTVILGRLEMAAIIAPPGSAQAQHIKDALEAGRRAAELTRQMLDFSGKGKAAVRKIDLSRILRSP